MSKSLSSLKKPVRSEGESEAELNRYLCFMLGDKAYAINILKVKEIIEHTEYTPIPMMPQFVWGAINLRGEVVPVIDLSLRLNLKATEQQKRTCFVIVEVSINDTRLDVGVVVDAVSRVADIPLEQHSAPPSFGGTINNEYVNGLGKVNGNFVLLLNIDKILSMRDLAALQQAGALGAQEQSQKTDA